MEKISGYFSDGYHPDSWNHTGTSTVPEDGCTTCTCDSRTSGHCNDEGYSVSTAKGNSIQGHGEYRVHEGHYNRVETFCRKFTGQFIRRGHIERGLLFPEQYVRSALKAQTRKGRDDNELYNDSKRSRKA